MKERYCQLDLCAIWNGDRIFTLVVPSSPQENDFTGYEQTNYTPLLEKGETTYG